MAAWAMVAVPAVGTALGLFRYTQINRRRIDRLEAQLEALSEAERIIARAHGHRDRNHLKLLGLIPVGWLIGPRARLAVASATSAAVLGVGFTASDTPLHQDPATPPAAAESSEDNPAVVDTPVRAHGVFPAPSVPPTSTTTTSAEASPPAPSADQTGPVQPQATPATSVPVPSTTTTTTTVLELPRPCLNHVPAFVPLCAAN
jgi:hypothetical protein